MSIPRTVFEAAVVYAQALMDRHVEQTLAIIMVVERQGIQLKGRLGTEGDIAHNHMVGWHEIEHAQYDALRNGLDKLVADL